MSLLDDITTSSDIKQLSRNQLTILAREIRERIIKVVSQNGGHLASSLGAVELTLAIHYVFDFPADTLVWDVGHQSYAHKLITGRNSSFDTLRQYKGLSGFAKIKESPFDGFTVGHSSTSISAGLGICTAKRLLNDPSEVIAVIGDGSMTAGLAYEGLNQTGDCGKNLIVILNDNDMSISANVGALSSFLSRTFSAKYLQTLRNQLGAFLKSIPKIGEDIYDIAKRSEESFKTFVTPGMLFEAFNLDYFGPIKGHNIDHLIDIMTNIKTHDAPILLHVTTTKGKGYEPAEKNPVYFHGVSGFEIDSGKSSSQASAGLPPTYTQVFGRQMLKLAQENDKLTAVTAAMPEGTGLVDFGQTYPDRFFDVGIAEQHAVTFAAGLASRGLKPVVAIYSTFLQRAYDQVVHDVCIDAHPVIFAIDRGGIVGEDGPTHHGLFDIAYLRNIPNMTVMAPGDELDLARMLTTAVYHDGPSAIRYPRGRASGVFIPDTVEPMTIGKAKVVQEHGEHLLIIAIGSSVAPSVTAAEKLEQHGILSTVINARFVKPLDKDLLLSYAKKIQHVITVEEHVLDGGFGSAVLELFSDNDLFKARVKRIGIQDRFVEHGAQDVLRNACGIDADAIFELGMRFNGAGE